MVNMDILISRESSIGKIKNVLIFLKNIFKMKKEIIVNRERFLESVYHLLFYGNILEKLDYTRRDSFTSGFSEDQIKTTAFSIQWNIMIITQSIIDELNKFLFNYKAIDLDLKNRIKAFRKIIAPAVEEINKWKDMREFRNNVLAHNGRNYNGESVILSSKFNNYDIPLHHNDFLILFKLLKIIVKTAEDIFAAENQEAEKIRDILNAKQKEVITDKQDSPETLNKINNILSEVKKRAARYNSMR